MLEGKNASHIAIRAIFFKTNWTFTITRRAFLWSHRKLCSCIDRLHLQYIYVICYTVYIQYVYIGIYSAFWSEDSVLEGGLNFLVGSIPSNFSAQCNVSPVITKEMTLYPYLSSPFQVTPHGCSLASFLSLEKFLLIWLPSIQSCSYFTSCISLFLSLYFGKSHSLHKFRPLLLFFLLYALLYYFFVRLLLTQKFWYHNIWEEKRLKHFFFNLFLKCTDHKKERTKFV